MITQQTFAAALKELYGDNIPRHTYMAKAQTNTFLALVEKKEDDGGEGFSTPIAILGFGGTSTDFNDAQDNQDDDDRLKFKFGWKKEYALGTVDRLTKLATGSKAHAVVDAVKDGMDAAMERINERLAAAVWGDGSGCIGRIADVTGTTITLEDPDDIVKFRVKQRVQANPNRTGNTATFRGGATARGFITVRDAESGTFTYEARDGFAPVAGDYLFSSKDYGNKLSGVSGWIPVTKPLAGDSWGGIDRSTDPLALAGLRKDVSGYTSHAQATVAAMGFWQREGVTPSHVFMHPTDFTAYKSELEERRQLQEAEIKVYGIGIPAIKLDNGAYLLPDTYAPKGYGWAMNMKTWRLRSLRKLPHVFQNASGAMLETLGNADAEGFRLGGYGQLECRNPHENGVFKLPTP